MNLTCRTLATILVSILLASTDGQAEGPAPFGLMFPADGATVHASTHGDVPLLVWQQSTGTNRYEIWMDGEKVDVIDARSFGHLPGDRAGNYESFRPYGFCADRKICYYTPLANRLETGPHQWRIVAVGSDGTTRLSSDAFRFQTEGFGPRKVWVNHLGYLTGTRGRIVVDASLEASSFSLVDHSGKILHRGPLKPLAVIGDYLAGEIPVIDGALRCQVRAGGETSMHFPIGLEAELNYEVYLRKYRNAYTRKRCGDTRTNWGGKPCHLEDARMEGDKRCELVGGWHASSDVRKIMRILQPAAHGLIELKRTHRPHWDQRDECIFDELKWGNLYFHKMQLKNGALLHHHYLWCGAEGWGEELNQFTNNKIGDEDDRVLPEASVRIDMASQSRFIQNQSAIYRLYKKEDPTYAGRCLAAATRCYQYFLKTWPVVTDYETEFCARPYMEPVTDIMPMTYAARAHLSMFLATGDADAKAQALAMADQIMDLQETNYIAGQYEIRGFFYKDATRKEIFDSLMAHGGMDGVESALTVLADLCDALPESPKRARWQESLRLYLQDYLMVLSSKNAFGIVPSYLSMDRRAGGQTERAEMQHQVGGIHYQYLCDNRGVNKALARKAILLARGARILDDRSLRDAAWRQVGWITGNNPLNMSTVFGVGQGQPQLYKEWLEPRSDGMVIQGIGGGRTDKPQILQNHWRHCEMELNQTAWLAEAVIELLATARPQ